MNDQNRQEFATLYFVVMIANTCARVRQRYIQPQVPLRSIIWTVELAQSLYNRAGLERCQEKNHVKRPTSNSEGTSTLRIE